MFYFVRGKLTEEPLGFEYLVAHGQGSLNGIPQSAVVGEEGAGGQHQGPRGCVAWQGDPLLLTLLLPFLHSVSSSSSVSLVELRTLGIVAKIVIFLVSAVKDFSTSGFMSSDNVFKFWVPTTRISMRVSRLISFSLSLKTQQHSIRENPSFRGPLWSRGYAHIVFSFFLVSL